MSKEEESKDRFFEETAAIAEKMIAAHGKDFAMGTLVLAARWIAENKSFADKTNDKAPNDMASID